MDTIIQPLPIRPKRGPYRRQSEEFKREAVALTLVEGASVSRIAGELKINTNQLFSWRKRFGSEPASSAAVASQLLPVMLVDTPLPSANVVAGVIVLNVGRAQLRLEGQVDVATLTLARIFHQKRSAAPCRSALL